MNIKEINELYKKLNEKAYKSNETLEDFYKRIIQNPKSKPSFYEVTEKLRINHYAIIHAYNKHQTKLEDWNYIIENFKLDNANLAQKQISKNNIYLCRIYNYGLAIVDCPNYCYISTLFKDHPNSINNWIKEGSRPHDVTQPTDNSRQNNSDSVAIHGLDPNNIITYLERKIKV